MAHHESICKYLSRSPCQHIATYVVGKSSLQAVGTPGRRECEWIRPRG